MDQFEAKWRYETEEDMKPSIGAINDPHFNPFSSGNLSHYPSSRNIENDQQISHQSANSKVSSNVFISYSSALMKGEDPNDSPFPSVNVISFGRGNSKSMLTNVNEVCTKSKSHVRPEADVILPMEISFSAPVAPSSGEENYVAGGYYEENIRKSGGGRDPLQAQVHILAERKRRQKLSERFVALSAMVPGLKRLDKASVLGGAIKHLKELEERVKVLEENGKKRHYEESAVSCKRKKLNLTGDTSSSDVDFDGGSQDTSLPEVDVRISGENVLLRVYCLKVDGIIKEILSEVEKFNLSVISSSAMPFGNTTLHVTIIAQLDSDFCMASEDLANNIRGFIMRLT